MAPRDITGKQTMRNIMEDLRTATAEQIFNEMRRRNAPVTDDTIWQYLINLVVNLPPAWKRWPQLTDRFLFLHENGVYELYNRTRHGRYEEGRLIGPPGSAT